MTARSGVTSYLLKFHLNNPVSMTRVTRDGEMDSARAAPAPQCGAPRAPRPDPASARRPATCPGRDRVRQEHRDSVQQDQRPLPRGHRASWRCGGGQQRHHHLRDGRRGGDGQLQRFGRQPLHRGCGHPQYQQGADGDLRRPQRDGAAERRHDQRDSSDGCGASDERQRVLRAGRDRDARPDRYRDRQQRGTDYCGHRPDHAG
jgi:hypothetical protein